MHPLMCRSSSLMTQMTLEIYTKSLGSEIGSDGFSDINGSATSTIPSFPPSLARRKVESAMEMSQERLDDRLLVKVVPVASTTTLTSFTAAS